MPRRKNGGPPERAPSTPNRLDITYGRIENARRYKLGRGSSAVVYRVELDHSNGTVSLAVKEPDFEGTLGAEQFGRFVEEAKTWEKLCGEDDQRESRLGHSDHIVEVLAWGEDSWPWIAMEYMDGGSLRDRLDELDGRERLNKALWIGTSICEGITYAHRRGVAHHDIKPSNVLFRSTTGGWSVPKVSDWGLAKVMLEEHGTEKGLTPAYAAPEQFHPDRYGSPDQRTDIYQLGVLVYELVTGRLPFEGAASEIREAKVSAQPPAPSEIADVPVAVDEALMPALGREKTERYEDVVYLRDELDAVFEQYHGNETGSGSDRGTAGSDIGLSDDEDEQFEDNRVTGKIDVDSGQKAGKQQDNTSTGTQSWDGYKRSLDERRQKALLYGVFKRVFYRDLAAEWENATARRENAAEKYQRAKKSAQELVHSLEDRLGERGEKLFGQRLSDETYARRWEVEEVRAKLDALLEDHAEYLTTDEQDIVARRRNSLVWYETYIPEKRKLDEAVGDIASRLDEIETRVEATLVDDSLLGPADERSLMTDLDDVSETLRRERLSLADDVLTDEDLAQFDELLDRERAIRERVEQHNHDIVQKRYRDLRDEGNAIHERSREAIETYRADGSVPGSLEEYIASLDDGIETIDAFLESRQTEYVSADQRERIEHEREQLDRNRTIVEAKADFETHLAELQAELDETRTAVDRLLDGETYLDPSEQTHIEEQLEDLAERSATIEEEQLLDPLTESDRDRFEACVATIEDLSRRVEEYNPQLVQQRYEEHVGAAENCLGAVREHIARCRNEGGPLPTEPQEISDQLQRTVGELAAFLNRPQARLLSDEQRSRIESRQSDLEEVREFVETKATFEAGLESVHDSLADFRTVTDEALDGERYLTASKRETLHERAERVRNGLDDIAAGKLLDTVPDGDAKRFEACRSILQELESEIDGYNDQFIKQERGRLADSIQRLPGVDLPNEKQELAVIRNEQYNRVIAGPGTGKTYSLLCRVRYLVDRGVPPEAILVLAYNNHTQGELNRRLNREFDVTGVTVSTLHSFGQGLVSDAYPDEFVLVGQSRLREVGRLVRELRETDDNFQRHYEAFIELYRDDQLSSGDKERRELYSSLKFQSNKTFHGEELEPADEESRKAHARIANTLFEHGVEYRYKQYADWADPSDGEQYCPDFTLPEHGISIDYLPSEAVKRKREWYEQRRSRAQLRELHDDTDRTPIIIHGDDISLGSIEGVLRAKVGQLGIRVDDPRGERTLVNEAYEHNSTWREIETRLAEFIKKAKTNRIDPSTRVSQLDAEENPMRYHFSHLGATVFDAYQERYAAYGAYDYADMMLRARESLQRGDVDDSLNYQHVLVDEFQDLNLVQIELLQAILDRSDGAHLFAVGDDWQSIYGFRGARPEFFVEFEERFSPATTTRLAINYRCPTAVIRASSAIMSESDIETDKSLEAAPSNPETTPIVHRLAETDDWQYETNVVTWATRRVTQSIETENRSPGDILVLARNEEGSPFVPRISTELNANDIPVDDDPDSVTVTTAHSAKGSEGDHVIVVNAVDDRSDGFPPEEQESSLTRLVEVGENDHIAEERRLFYMAVTRAKERLDIQTRVGHESVFLDPLDKHVDHESTPIDWAAERISVTGQVENPTESHRPRQLGTLVIDGYYLSYIIPFDAIDVALLDEGRRYRLSNVAVAEYEGDPQLRIDDATTVELL